MVEINKKVFCLYLTFKVNWSFSTWKETSGGAHQGSVLGPLLFDIYLNALFSFVSDSKYATMLMIQQSMSAIATMK